MSLSIYKCRGSIYKYWLSICKCHVLFINVFYLWMSSIYKCHHGFILWSTIYEFILWSIIYERRSIWGSLLLCRQPLILWKKSPSKEWFCKEWLKVNCRRISVPITLVGSEYDICLWYKWSCNGSNAVATVTAAVATAVLEHCYCWHWANID